MNGTNSLIGGGGFHHDFALRAADYDAAHSLALKAGAVETMAPRDVEIPSRPKPLSVRISFVKAPGGEIIEFFTEKSNVTA